jgi:C4-dicarboxylate transporter, DctQ subunit
MSELSKIHDRISDVAFALACIALIILLGAYLVEVISRYGFNAPTRWSSDLVQYMLAASTALALPTVTKDNGHVAITSFLEKLSLPRQVFWSRWIHALGAIVLAVASAVFVSVALDQRTQGIETVAAFTIPKWWLTALVVFGLLSAALHLLRQSLQTQVAIVGHEMDV